MLYRAALRLRTRMRAPRISWSLSCIQSRLLVRLHLCDHLPLPIPSDRQPAMSRRTLRLLLILEVVVCFALPAYFLVWGLVTLPVWLAGIGSLDNVINVACIFGGLLGMFGLACALVQATQSETPGMEIAVANSLLGLIGVISLWTIMTDRFRGLEINWFLVFVLLPPTICGVHLAVLVFRRIAHHERP